MYHNQQLNLQSSLNPTLTISNRLPTALVSSRHDPIVSRFGHSILWTVFALMNLSSVIFWILTGLQQKNNKIFHHITLTITFIAAVSYYTMASGLGISVFHDGERPLFWARYLDWLLTTPLLLTDLGLLAGVPVQDILLLVVSDLAMVVTGLLGAFNQSESTKWGFFGMSCIFFLYIVLELVTTLRRTSYLKSSRVGFLFTVIAVYSVLVWSAYPVVWAVSEGAKIITTDFEILLYAILDIMAKAVFGFWLLIAHSIIPESNVILSTTFTDPQMHNGIGYGALDINEELSHE
ncbi:hypothetical protein CROQUDRAFT_88563 [Cronartium quercuum f. sp. fusiforme G11]|uniref:Opsin-1 n=1 Tax=Cronartium quercuum f. sp. fusiforme G11 TaxID=708437 RepID=A0A9P6TFJ4_9BASI|nr:hypothetical protein CROQUDRAFT_88563 [Cronartium quercuum f. sp. fusiforme G11]